MVRCWLKPSGVFFLVVLTFMCLMDPSRILIWNVRGLNSSSRQDSLHSLVDSSRPDIVCVQETKISDMSRRVILSALGFDFSEFVVVPSIGASGGILIA